MVDTPVKQKTNGGQLYLRRALHAGKSDLSLVVVRLKPNASS